MYMAALLTHSSSGFIKNPLNAKLVTFFSILSRNASNDAIIASRIPLQQKSLEKGR